MVKREEKRSKNVPLKVGIFSTKLLNGNQIRFFLKMEI
jgi:hypothetical protein